MNESEDARNASITMEWEFVPGIPANFLVTQPVWLDITGECGNSEKEVPEAPVFEFSSLAWSPAITGDLIYTVGHLHDGGSKIELFKNGQLICNGVAAYGESEGFLTHVGLYGHEHDHKEEPEHEHEHEHEHEEEPEHEHEHEHEHELEEEPEHEHEHEHEEEPAEGEPGSHHDHSSGDHIEHVSSISPACTNLGRVSEADKFAITAHYNMTAHQGMAGHHGGKEPVMGIFMLYLAGTPSEVNKAAFQ